MYSGELIDSELTMTKHAPAKSFARPLPESSVCAALARTRRAHPRCSAIRHRQEGGGKRAQVRRRHLAERGSACGLYAGRSHSDRLPKP
jgi:hypothetical protein